jgi:hypothetical protein
VILGIALTAMGAVVAGVLVVLIVIQLMPTQGDVEVLHPIYPEPEPGSDPVAASDGGSEWVAPAPVAGQPLRLVIPSVGLDVSVGSMSVPASRRIDPPTPGSAYWIRGYSVVGPNAPGTAYIAGHTYRGTGNAVFNSLFNLDTREAIIRAGDTIQVSAIDGGWNYTVTNVVNYDKATVQEQDELWSDVPGRLVLVACQYNGASSAVQNLVVYAQLDAP